MHCPMYPELPNHSYQTCPLCRYCLFHCICVQWYQCVDCIRTYDKVNRCGTCGLCYLCCGCFTAYDRVLWRYGIIRARIPIDEPYISMGITATTYTLDTHTGVTTVDISFQMRDSKTGVTNTFTHKDLPDTGNNDVVAWLQVVRDEQLLMLENGYSIVVYGQAQRNNQATGTKDYVLDVSEPHNKVPCKGDCGGFVILRQDVPTGGKMAGKQVRELACENYNYREDAQKDDKGGHTVKPLWDWQKDENLVVELVVAGGRQVGRTFIPNRVTVALPPIFGEKASNVYNDTADTAAPKTDNDDPDDIPFEQAVTSTAKQKGVSAKR